MNLTHESACAKIESETIDMQEIERTGYAKLMSFYIHLVIVLNEETNKNQHYRQHFINGCC